MAHEIPYVATATVADLHDLEAKVDHGDVDARRPLPARAGAVPARLGHRRRPTPSGWPGWPPSRGLFPVFEAEHGEVTDVRRIRRQVPVEDYLRLQTRFAHLFGDAGHPDVVAAPAAPGRPRHRPLRAGRRTAKETP